VPAVGGLLRKRACGPRREYAPNGSNKQSGFRLQAELATTFFVTIDYIKIYTMNTMKRVMADELFTWNGAK
jgi:hypothetical protein